MSNTLKREIIIIAICLPIGVALTYFTLPKKGDVVVYNCSISEISPDYPPKVKEECRKLRAENFNKDLQKPK